MGPASKRAAVVLQLLLLLTGWVAVCAREAVSPQAHDAAEVEPQPLQELQALNTVALASQKNRHSQASSQRQQAAAGHIRHVYGVHQRWAGVRSVTAAVVCKQPQLSCAQQLLSC